MREMVHVAYIILQILLSKYDVNSVPTHNISNVMRREPYTEFYMSCTAEHPLGYIRRVCLKHLSIVTHTWQIAHYSSLLNKGKNRAKQAESDLFREDHNERYRIGFE